MAFLYMAMALVPGLGLLVSSYRRKKRLLETPIPLRVREWQHHGERYTTLTLEPAGGARLPTWTPGSHLIVNVDGPDGTYRRAYSLLGGDAGSYQIAVARQRHGKVSGYLLDGLYIGKPVRAQPPRGRFFKLQQPPAGRICLIGGGVGIAPLIPLARQALQQGIEVQLIHAARHARELIQYPQLRALADQDQRLRYTAVVSRDLLADGELLHGRVDLQRLQQLGLRDYPGDVYLCGSSAFVKAQAANIAQLGGSGRVFEEAFTGNDSELPFRIRVDGKQFQQGHAPTLLAACEENGVLPFAECRTGHCLNCRATLKQGRVNWLMPNKGPPLPPGQILTCACVPASDIELELRS